MNDRYLDVECPKCHALPGQPCRNYLGKPCAPHGKRMKSPEDRTVQKMLLSHLDDNPNQQTLFEEP